MLQQPLVCCQYIIVYKIASSTVLIATATAAKNVSDLLLCLCSPLHNVLSQVFSNSVVIQLPAFKVHQPLCLWGIFSSDAYPVVYGKQALKRDHILVCSFGLADQIKWGWRGGCLWKKGMQRKGALLFDSLETKMIKSKWGKKYNVFFPLQCHHFWTQWSQQRPEKNKIGKKLCIQTSYRGLLLNCAVFQYMQNYKLRISKQSHPDEIFKQGQA